ncbi:MAG: nucleoside phosphorylase [Desulfobacteraceae bacterium]|nr:nucleoside phosphorylase [Desulfobacteraceae bacterium]
MESNHAIVVPAKTPESPSLGPVAIITATEPDLRYAVKQCGFSGTHAVSLYMSRVYPGGDDTAAFSIAGPVLGAPYAVMVLETLIAWGVRKLIFIGWCGSISGNAEIGDIILPDNAYIDEGTSAHYNRIPPGPVPPSPGLFGNLKAAFGRNQVPCHIGSVWTTDGVFRETPQKVRHYQDLDAMAVEMETSALFTVAQFHRMDLAAVLVVSDDLSSMKWRPGFRDKRFTSGCKSAAEMVFQCCQKI